MGSLLALGAAQGPAAPPVLTGLDVLVAEGATALRGKRLGLVVHSASVTAEGRHAIDVLRGLGLKVVRLFAAEHGLRSDRAAGERFGDDVDAGTGLPVVSLYKGQAGVQPRDLEGLDALVYDLQDAGVRFYTYESELILALEAVAAAGIEMVVLDRPNPLGGERMEGPQSAPRDVVPASHVNRAPGPLLHGLTTGELARFVAARSSRGARLTVIPMRGWRRSMVWSDTGRPWVPPSPNLRSAQAALAYPGVCLLEATNVSEGRGTESPFLLLGAPWVDTARLQRDVAAPGFGLAKATFTPLAMPAAPRPKHVNAECHGLRVRVDDARAARPYTLGIALLHALRRQPGFAWTTAPVHPLDRLLGTRSVREALERGQGVKAIVSADEADIRRWRRERGPALLY